MSLFKRPGSPFWWARFTHHGRRIQKSTGTADRAQAQHFHDRLKAELWQQDRLGTRPVRHWQDAVFRFLKETSHKASHEDDKRRLRWLDAYLAGKRLDEISRDLVDRIGELKKRQSSAATANRHLALIRTILRRAWADWDWLDKPPRVRLYPEPKRRIRFLTRPEAERLLSALPTHQADAARFALATGLRQSNILHLEWSQVDVERRTAWIHPDQAKARHAIAVPLNAEAMEVLGRQIGKHARAVFTYQGQPIQQISTRAWRAALQRAGIADFRWHDLRHTWASWHAMAGTSMQELQELGGWETAAMVRKYAHLSARHLAEAADRISAPQLQNLLQSEGGESTGTGIQSPNPLVVAK